ncbi:MAG: hypothetical protein QOE77_3318 [Blastocatellia bacterium]|nr:hypothetical protein [Blastocatellia bacterium]
MRANTNEPVRSPYRPVCDLLASRFGNNRWIVFSLRLWRLVILFSDLEFDHWILIEANFRIVSYCEQPLRMRAKIAGALVTTVPDMWLLFESGQEQFREVKFRSQLTEPRVIRQLQAQKTWCGIESTPHDVFDEYRIRRNPRYIRSWKFILRVLAATHKTNLHPICQKVSHLLRNGPLTLRHLEANCVGAERGLLRPAVFKMLHAGQVKAPLGSQEITNDLPVELRQ